MHRAPDGTLEVDEGSPMRIQPPHERRVIEERAQLSERLEKLGTFLALPDFGKLESAEQDRLTRQHKIMREYLQVLDERIAAFPK